MKIRIPRLHGDSFGTDDVGDLLRPADGGEPREKVGMHIDSAAFMSMLIEVATNAWKAQRRLRARGQEEPDSDRRLLERNLDAVLSSLESFGVSVQDHTGDAYDYGQALKVVAAQPQDGIAREVVTETIRPTVTWNGHTLQRGEVVIATPKEHE